MDCKLLLTDRLLKYGKGLIVLEIKELVLMLGSQFGFKKNDITLISIELIIKRLINQFIKLT